MSARNSSSLMLEAAVRTIIRRGRFALAADDALQALALLSLLILRETPM